MYNCDPKWFTPKFCGPGLRYEVGVFIATGHIVWLQGPYPCGDWPDVRIARSCLHFWLLPWEKYVSDGLYKLCRGYAMTPVRRERSHMDYVRGVVRARHESVNRRFKIFKILSHKYCHPIETHGDVFRSVSNIVQILLENGMPMYDIEGYMD